MQIPIRCRELAGRGVFGHRVGAVLRGEVSETCREGREYALGESEDS